MKGNGMFQDRDTMGKKAVHKKMGEYFPKQYNPDNPDNYYAGGIDDGTAQRMEGAGVHQSRELTEDGRAIDASKPNEQMEEAETPQIQKKTKTFVNSRNKTKTLVTNPSVKAKTIEGNPYKISKYDVDPINAAIAALNSAEPGTKYVNTGEVDQKVKFDRKPATVEFTGRRGNTKTAEVGTRKAKRLQKKFKRGQGDIISTDKYSPTSKSYTTKKGTLNIKVG